MLVWDGDRPRIRNAAIHFGLFVAGEDLQIALTLELPGADVEGCRGYGLNGWFCRQCVV